MIEFEIYKNEYTNNSDLKLETKDQSTQTSNLFYLKINMHELICSEIVGNINEEQYI